MIQSGLYRYHEQPDGIVRSCGIAAIAWMAVDGNLPLNLGL
jgi:hypothetical protein